MLLDSDSDTIIELIKLCLSEEKETKRLKLAYNVAQMVMEIETPDKLKEETKKTMEYLKGLMLDIKFQRDLKKRMALVDKEPIVYFGDINKGDYYDYDEAFEDALMRIDFRVTEYLGKVLTYIQTGGSY